MKGWWKQIRLCSSICYVPGGSHGLEPPLISDLALPHYDTCDVSAITNLPYMVALHDLGQCAIALSQLENAQ